MNGAGLSWRNVRSLVNSSRFLTSLFLAIFALSPAKTKACTIFVLTDSEHVLFCNNEDWWNPNTRIWFDPGDSSHFGCAVVGYDDGWWQGGLNTSGLAFDWVAGWNEQWERKPGTETVDGNPKNLMLQTCTTVDQAIAFYQSHWDSSFAHAKILIADSSGASVIIGAHLGSLTIERENKCRGFGYGHRVLERMLAQDSQPTLANGANILWAARQEGYAATKYSNVYDLKSGDIYLFPFQGRKDTVRFNLKEELSKGGHFYDMPAITEQMAQEPRALSLMKPLPQPPLKEITLPIATLRDYVGSYPIRSNFVVTLSLERDELYLEVTGQDKARVFAWSKDELFLTARDAKISLHRDASGDVDGLILHQNGQNVPAKKVVD